ncbi:hypothetical protein K3495_g1830 [Podosphaera aphanis]|nr:hypothetical protein K3495_g1830 [Podosphaera aphanis]
MIPSERIVNRKHFGFAHLVDDISEPWHERCWGASIRAALPDAARTINGDVIFPSQFVEYSTPLGNQIGQILWVGRVQRLESLTFNEIVHGVAPVYHASKLCDHAMYNNHDFPDDGIGPTRVQISWIYNKEEGFRTVLESDPIRGELEVEQFGREYLATLVGQNTISLPIFVFADDFGLNRKKHHSITGVYFMPAGIRFEERQKGPSLYSLVLGPHGSKLDNTLPVIHSCMVNLGRGCLMDINGTIFTVLAPILAIVRDMKGQQEALGFKGPSAHRSCRFCYAKASDNRHMLDEAQNSRQRRYYFQLVKLRDEMTSMTTAERVRMCRNHGISDTPSYLETLAPELDTILSRPIDLMHSKFLGLSRRLYALLVDKILRTKAFPAFTTVFRRLRLPAGWSRIQSIEKHIGFWTASDAAKDSITMPILLRQWLHRQYNDVVLAGRNYWLQLIKAASSLQVTKTTPLRIEPSRRPVLSASGGSVYLYSPRIDIPTDESFYDAASESSAKPYIPSFSRYTASQLSQLTRLQQTENLVQSTGGVDNLPNFHTGAHFELMRQEYGNPWIANFFWGEDKHRFFKGRASRMNHQNPERDPLDKERIHSSIRGILN